MRICGRKAEDWSCDICSPIFAQNLENEVGSAYYNFANNVVNSTKQTLKDLSPTKDPRTGNLSGDDTRRGKEEIEQIHPKTSNTHLMT